jgi:RimJ/RimL family protein N-acetyltransferase
MEMPTLETERLLIRPLAPDDLEACLRVLDDGPATAPEAVEARRAWLEWTVASYVQLARLHQPPYGERAIALRDGGRVVGACGYAPCLEPFGQLPSFRLPPDRRFSAEVGLFWALAPEHRGRGYATEAAAALIRHAFESLRLRRVVATTSDDNRASAAVMRRLGMRVERNPLAEPHWLQVVGVLDHEPAQGASLSA